MGQIKQGALEALERVTREFWFPNMGKKTRDLVWSALASPASVPVRSGSQAQVIADILEHGTGTYTVDESVEYESEEDVFVGVQRIQGLEPEVQPAPDAEPVCNRCKCVETMERQVCALNGDCDCHRCIPELDAHLEDCDCKPAEADSGGARWDSE